MRWDDGPGSACEKLQGILICAAQMTEGQPIRDGLQLSSWDGCFRAVWSGLGKSDSL